MVMLRDHLRELAASPPYRYTEKSGGYMMICDVSLHGDQFFFT